MYALLEDQRKEIKAVNQEIAMKEAEIDRKNDEIAQIKQHKDTFELDIGDIAKKIQDGREMKLVDQQFVRRTGNQNKITKDKIEQIRLNIEALMEKTDENIRCNKIKQNENDDLKKELEALNKHIILLNDQNIELENELERFLHNDNEIRARLMEREASLSRSRSPPAERLFVDYNKLERTD